MYDVISIKVSKVFASAHTAARHFPVRCWCPRLIVYLSEADFIGIFDASESSSKQKLLHKRKGKRQKIRMYKK